MQYSEKFENKRKKINSLYFENKKDEDLAILKTVYNIANITDAYGSSYIDNTALNQTRYSHYDDIKLINSFKPEIFNKLEKHELTHLFQEVYNRQTVNHDMEKRYIVSVKGSVEECVNGYIVNCTNELSINHGIINYYKEKDRTSALPIGKHKENIGFHTLFTLLHETQHSFQYESLLNFILKEDVDDEKTRNRNSIFFLKSCLQEACFTYTKDSEKMDYLYSLQALIRQNYFSDFSEHDANMAPIKFLNKNLEENKIDDEAFLTAAKERIIKDIHIDECLTEEEIYNALKERIKRMNDYVHDLVCYFKILIKDGAMKSDILNQVENYIKVDENGNSKFKQDLAEDFAMCLNFIKKAKVNNQNKTENEEKTF